MTYILDKISLRELHFLLPIEHDQNILISSCTYTHGLEIEFAIIITKY